MSSDPGLSVLWVVVSGMQRFYMVAYASQREVSHDRALRRAQNIRKKLGGSVNMLESFPAKPKGMHWHTYMRMEDQHNAFYNITLVGMAKQIGMKIDV